MLLTPDSGWHRDVEETCSASSGAQDVIASARSPGMCIGRQLALDCPDLKAQPATSLQVLLTLNPQPSTLNPHLSAITTCVTAGSMPTSGGHRMWSR